jgi:hypothetical protein
MPMLPACMRTSGSVCKVAWLFLPFAFHLMPLHSNGIKLALLRNVAIDRVGCKLRLRLVAPAVQ